MSDYQHSTVTVDNESLYRQAIIDTCRSLQGNVLVDVGSWDGSFTEPVAKAVKAKKVICIDHDKAALQRARKRGFVGKVGNLNEQFPLASHSADVVLASQVIEHIAKTDLFAKEIHRVLKPKGIAVICTPNLSSWHNVAALALGFQPFSMQISDQAFLGNPLHPLNHQPINEEQAHLRVFTRYSLADLLAHHGFTIKRNIGVGFYPFSGNFAQLFSRIDPIHSAYILVVAEKN